MADPNLQQHNGIRTRVYIGGKYTTRDPLVQIGSKRFEAKQRTSNLAMRVDRAFTLAGMPNVRMRREFVLPWSDLREPGMLEHIDILTAVGQPFALGLWKHEYDVFDGDAENKTFYLQRRQLLEVTTPVILPGDYPTRVTRYDKSYLDPAAVATELAVVQKLAADIDTGDPAAGEAWVESDGHMIGNLWVSKLRVGTAPPDAHDCLVAAYLPLYAVLIDAEQTRSYPQSLMEPRTLKMIEFG